MMRCALPLFLAGCLTELPDLDQPCEPWDKPGLYSLNIQSGGIKRKSWVYVPADSAGPRDLVMALHGAGGTGRAMMEVTQYTDLADELGFVVAFPDGTRPFPNRPSWNAGDCCLSADEQHRDVDDVAYLDALAKELQQRTCSDRILATGFSNGGMLSHRWACTSDLVDAAVPVGGGLAWDSCKGEPIPLRHYHGANDPIVPIAGSTEIPPLRKSLIPWRDRNQCDDGDPEIVTKGRLTCEVYPCAAPTELCILSDWPHKWPGGVNGSQTGGLDAAAEGYAFFLEHAPPREEPTTGRSR